MRESALAPPPNYSRLSRVYAALEWLSFGRALARRRSCFLDDSRIAGARRALVLGDGDGRFTAALLERYPALEIIAVDASAGMLRELARRVKARTPTARLELHCADVRCWPIPDARYDLVITHFFLDCFTTRELSSLIGNVASKLAPNAHWLVSEFAIPSHALWAAFARVLVRFLYFMQGVLTGLALRELPEYRGALESAHFELVDCELALGGMLRSELWQKRRVR
ncbi:MAG TPA: class I SAM-dependent methyltransferase [Polyangiaceae bacterium]|nr:class I SAM-dependent methyltransferase [Polyangiaceae bacterium]